MQKFDVVVIGAGQAGIPLAKKFAKAGKKVAVIEKRVIGGTCINDGCSPTKTMIASARVAYLTKNGAKWGALSDNFRIDYETVLKRKNDIIESFRNGAIKGLEKEKNITIFMGLGYFETANHVKVELENETVDIYGETIFINTGCSPRIPNIKGLDKTQYLTSTSLMELTEIPEHLIILGGGYIALEFGQMMGRFGAKVTILEKSDTLLPHEDNDVCVAITDIFKSENIEIHTSTEILAVSGDHRKTVSTKIKGKEQTFTGSHILVATGREPQTKNLKLSFAGVKTDDNGFIEVNDKLETSAKNIYALGDVKGGPAFTQIAYNDHLVIVDNLLKGKNHSIKDRIVPYCMFTDPQLGRVGITEDEAKEKKLNYKVAKLEMKYVARALETGETKGYMKAIVDAKTKQILGASIIGEQGGEIMSVLQMAMMGGITYEQIRNNIFAHPLFSESLNNLFMSLDE
ncbi:mercuric reductase [Pedobacter psychrophilus]|uniref:Dihydrolipoyl dehydrogenase n=1 Tax=Pedobacter psychrophilus TaxID=1826909 RepID=A0A179DAC5_9SPHI|nr:dihydrolipoyl dehydrogenase [Pedobacter psychrophilus]OAQ37948.1 mercuric reductase [Pedobacter psychrophilus]